MKIEKVEFILMLGECSEQQIAELEVGLGEKRKDDGNELEAYIQIYSDYSNVGSLLDIVKDFLDHDIPVVMRKCYEEVEE